MIYQLVLFIHVLSAVGWAGLTTGAYMLIKWSDIDDETLRRLLPSYRKLVALEAGSLALAGSTGLYLWHMLLFPSWALFALALTPVLIAGEALHYRASKSPELFKQKMKPLSIFYIVVGLFIFWIMIFKPFWIF